ncbi:MAG: hypothetical protein WC273_04365 [Dehalococcoidia bacterium]
MPALGFSLFLVTLGAILLWAVNVPAAGAINIRAVGAILFAVGTLGSILAMLFWTSFAPFGTHVHERDTHEHLHVE